MGKKHEPNESAGITPEIAAELDAAMEAMESGNPDGDLHWDESGETYDSFSQADVGEGTFARHRRSSNEQIAFGSLVHRIKNQNPDLEYDEAYDMAVDEWGARYGHGDEEEEG